MKRATSQQHKELALLCEERISKLEAQSFLLVLQVSRIVVATINETITCKSSMYYTIAIALTTTWKHVKVNKKIEPLLHS
jgi:hypothetical protein